MVVRIPLLGPAPTRPGVAPVPRDHSRVRGAEPRPPTLSAARGRQVILSAGRVASPRRHDSCVHAGGQTLRNQGGFPIDGRMTPGPIVRVPNNRIPADQPGLRARALDRREHMDRPRTLQKSGAAMLHGRNQSSAPGCPRPPRPAPGRAAGPSTTARLGAERQHPHECPHARVLHAQRQRCARGRRRRGTGRRSAEPDRLRAVDERGDRWGSGVLRVRTRLPASAPFRKAGERSADG
jgi:hypothetical protein